MNNSSRIFQRVIPFRKIACVITPTFSVFVVLIVFLCSISSGKVSREESKVDYESLVQEMIGFHREHYSFFGFKPSQNHEGDACPSNWLNATEEQNIPSTWMNVRLFGEAPFFKLPNQLADSITSGRGSRFHSNNVSLISVFETDDYKLAFTLEKGITAVALIRLDLYRIKFTLDQDLVSRVQAKIAQVTDLDVRKQQVVSSAIDYQFQPSESTEEILFQIVIREALAAANFLDDTCSYSHGKRDILISPPLPDWSKHCAINLSFYESGKFVFDAVILFKAKCPSKETHKCIRLCCCSLLEWWLNSDFNVSQDDWLLQVVRPGFLSKVGHN